MGLVSHLTQVRVWSGPRDHSTRKNARMEAAARTPRGHLAPDPRRPHTRFPNLDHGWVVLTIRPRDGAVNIAIHGSREPHSFFPLENS
jgi:hypothetical protein